MITTDQTIIENEIIQTMKNREMTTRPYIIEELESYHWMTFSKNQKMEMIDNISSKLA